MDARRAEGIALLALQAFTTLSCVAGGVGLVYGTIDLPLDWLNGTFFSDYVIPGVILAGIVGGFQLAALISALGRHSSYLMATALAGAVLMGWMIGEWFIVGAKDSVMFGFQIVYFLVGFVEFSTASVELRRLASRQ